MANKSKKRTKRYTGEDAKTTGTTTQPVVHRFEAVQRNAAQEWWNSNKRLVKVGTYTVGGLAVFSWLIFELIQIVF